MDPVAFETAIWQHGNRLLWEKSAPCPCRNSNENDHPLVTCPTCDGDGWEYWGPQVIRGVCAALDFDQDTQVAYGIWSKGTIRCTQRSEHRPGFRDRFTNLDGVARFDEWRTRKADTGSLERLRYFIGVRFFDVHESELPRLSDAMNPEVIAAALEEAQERAEAAAHSLTAERVARLRVMDPDTREPGSVLEEGIDFDVVDGQIDWAKGDLRGTAPAVGNFFGVSYNYHPRYLVTSFDHVSRDQWIIQKRPGAVLARMPVEWRGKLDSVRGDDG